ncbi:MAG: DUF433 domain-containing protein [Gemmataceae bacterium]|nr:DUF433 domain-containing protein [Gemmataceae bacterium]
MPVTPELVEQASRLTPAEWQELWIKARENLPPSRFGRINRTPGVCGGEACLGHSRITVWGLERLRQLGASDAHILSGYPHLGPDDLAEAWAYVAAHRDEIEDAIRRNEEA